MLKAVRDSINAFAVLHKITEITTGLLIPVMVGLLATFQEKLLAISPFLFWGLLGMVAVLAFGLTLASLRIRTAPEIYFDWQQEKTANERISKDIRYAALLESEILAMNALVRGYAAMPITTAAALSEAIKTICSGIVEERNGYFDFSYREKWNFAVYLWNPTSNRLEPVWREKARGHPSQGMGRPWGDGEGHVGHAFRNKQVLITSNAQSAEVAALIDTGQNTQSYDAETYRSYVSHPILATDPNARPYGVVVATSDKVGRFDPANSRILNHAAVALATLIETAYDST